MNDGFPHLRIVAIIQARMGATRLPGKPLIAIGNKPVLHYVVTRLKRVKYPLEVVVATTTNSQDDQIVQFCQQEKIASFRGSEGDVLARYLFTARHYNADVVIRITADCPLIDPLIIDEALDSFLLNYPDIDYLSNTLDRTYPRGLDVEIFKRRALEQAFEEGFLGYQREHVTPYLYQHPEKFSLKGVQYSKDLSHLRLTLDTKEDLELIEKIILTLYPRNPNFTFEDILKLFELHPDWPFINAHIEQKPL